jgi:hypothetical protein
VNLFNLPSALAMNIVLGTYNEFYQKTYQWSTSLPII